MLLTFFLAVFGWIVFRAESIGQAWEYVCGIMDKSLFTLPGLNMVYYLYILFVLLMLVVEWLQRGKSHGLQFDSVGRKGLKWALYVFLFVLIEFYYLKSIGHPVHFIYFQF